MNKETNIVSIDVGIKNLSICQLLLQSNDENEKVEPKYTISYWNNIDISFPPKNTSVDPFFDHIENENHQKCSACTQKSTFKSPRGTFLCTRHANRSGYIHPSKNIKLGILKSSNIDELSNICFTNLIPIVTQPKTKKSFVEMITTYYLDHTLIPLDSFGNECIYVAGKLNMNGKKKFKLKPKFKPNLNTIQESNFEQSSVSNSKKKTATNEIHLSDIGRNITAHLDPTFPQNSVDIVLIENQIGPLAGRMKSIQAMLVQYFIMRHNHVKIEFVGATVKLKPFVFGSTIQLQDDSTPESESKNIYYDDIESDLNEIANDTTNNAENDKIKRRAYSERKKTGVHACTYVLNLTTDDIWLKYMQSNKKKDDLCDCFLQVWATYIWNKIPIILSTSL